MFLQTLHNAHFANNNLVFAGEVYHDLTTAHKRLAEWQNSTPACIFGNDQAGGQNETGYVILTDDNTQHFTKTTLKRTDKPSLTALYQNFFNSLAFDLKRDFMIDELQNLSHKSYYHTLWQSQEYENLDDYTVEYTGRAGIFKRVKVKAFSKRTNLAPLQSILTQSPLAGAIEIYKDGFLLVSLTPRLLLLDDTVWDKDRFINEALNNPMVQYALDGQTESFSVYLSNLLTKDLPMVK